MRIICIVTQKQMEKKSTINIVKSILQISMKQYVKSTGGQLPH